jgi:ADP-heptose:LPS heptosyltransferase
MGRPSTLLHYGKWIGEIDRIAPPKKHIITEILLKGGITGKVSIRPYWFGDTKSTTIRTQKPYFCVQSTNTHSSTPMLNKKWQEDKMIAVLNSLSSKYDIVQLGVNEEPRFKSTIDARNSSISDSSAILANSEFFIGQVGFLMHLARAVNTRSIIIYGGREKAWQSGYPCNENLETNPNCSPCWQNNQCEYNRKCLSDISVAQVLQAVDRIELRKPTEMETEIVDI